MFILEQLFLLVIILLFPIIFGMFVNWITEKGYQGYLERQKLKEKRHGEYLQAYIRSHVRRIKRLEGKK